MFLHKGDQNTILNDDDKVALIDEMIEKLGDKIKKVLIIPPDFTRFYSDAGRLTAIVYEKLHNKAQIDIMPALGTHVPMKKEQIEVMFGKNIPLSCFLDHDWRNGVVDCGVVSAEKIGELSEGSVEYEMKVAVNKQLFEGQYDLVLSIGQIVPHEVIGMANYTKNICIGIGGSDMINKSHFLGAAYGMEKILGRTDTPVRSVLDYSYNEFLSELPVIFLLSVMEARDSDVVMRGLYCSEDRRAFVEAADLSRKVNLDLLDEPIQKAVVYLDPEEFHSTWLGNKAIYRLRMAMADDGELIILAPELKEFGEDSEIDRLIRKYGYRGTPTTLKAVKENEDLRNNLSAAAHLIHGSSEGRFKITYCPGPGVSREEIENVGFEYMTYKEAVIKYPFESFKMGMNQINDEEVFYVSNPALGLWALRSQFE
jgi:nickel-dependent lactate racemase